MVSMRQPTPHHPGGGLLCLCSPLNSPIRNLTVNIRDMKASGRWLLTEPCRRLAALRPLTPGPLDDRGEVVLALDRCSILRYTVSLSGYGPGHST